MIALAGFAAILLLTLIPDSGQAPFSAMTPFWCLVCGDHGGSDVFLNVLLFIPMAAGLRLFGWSWWRAFAASAALSITVESLQYSVVTGRDASLSDVLTNTTGGAIGAWIGARLALLLAPDRALARVLFPAGVALWLGTIGFSALALRPWVQAGWMRNDCTRSYDTPHRFLRTVSSVRINGVAIACDADVEPLRAVRSSLGRGEVTIETAMLSGNPTDGQRLIHGLHVRRGFALMLAQDGRAAAFTAPALADLFRLHAPVLRLRGAFPTRPGVPVEVDAGMHAGRLWVRARRPGFEERLELAMSPSFGWSLLLPWGVPAGSPLRVVTGLWIVGLLLPAAYWAGFMARPLLGGGAIAVALVGGLGLLPRLAGYPPVHWSEWLAGGFAVGLGWALHRLAAYLQSRCGSPSTSAYSSP